MHSYGSNTHAGRGQYQHQHQYSTQYNQYQYPTTQSSGQQQPATNTSQYQPPYQSYDSQNSQYSQTQWSSQQHQTSYPQQNASAAYSPTSGHGYQNSFQQAPNSHHHNNNNNNPRNRPNTTPTSQNCYNCGGADHWAQNCPEPRRANPVGAMNDQRPSKRQKTSGPVVTRYPPPPNYQQRGAHRGYTHPPINHAKGHQLNNYPNVQTPVSANPYNANQWQQSPVQQSPQSHQSVPSTPWAQPGVQTPASQFGSPSSTPGASHQSSFPSNNGGQYPQGSELKRNSFDSAGKPSRRNSQFSDHDTATVLPQKGNPDGPFFAVEHLEPWMEELQALDIPDVQSNSSTIVWHPPNPVAQVLPSTAVEADAVGRLPIAATLPPGVPVSMYFQDKSSDDMKHPVEETPQWQEVKFDPVFIAVDSEGPVIPIPELISRRKALMEQGDDETEGNEEQYSQYDELDPNLPGDDARVMTLEMHARTNVDPTAWQDKQRAASNREADEERRTMEQEEKLAALGVTGPPKPVRGPLSQSGVVSQQADADMRSPPMDQCADEHDVQNNPTPQPAEEQHNRQVPASTPSKPPEPRKPPKEKQVYTEAQEALQGFPTEDSDASQSTAPSPSDYRASDGLAQSIDGQLEHSTTDVHVTSKEQSNGHRESADALATPDSKAKSLSPSNPRLTSSDSRKRSFREPSEESDGGQRRQFDDTKQRLKRRQPHVAEAYGRRW